MHSGYPIMAHMDFAERALDAGRMAREGDWGIFHELGHNMQRAWWTWGSASEVTVNLFSLHAMEEVVGRAPALAFDARSREEAHAFAAAGRPYAQWCSKPFVALHMYVELIAAFGWDILRQVLKGYEDDPPGGLDTDGKKMGEWAVRYSRAAGMNLVGFFAARWNLPFDKAAAEARARGGPCAVVPRVCFLQC
jgi:hypothetical protein